MNRVLPYRKLPISITRVILLILILLSVVIVQSAVSNNWQHILFLSVSYFTWGVLLPFIQGAIEAYTFKLDRVRLLIVNVIAIILLHFFVSNVIYYAIQYYFVETFLAPSIDLFIQIIGPALFARIIDFALFFGVLSWIHRTRDLNNKERELILTETNLQKMKLRSLQSQLNPHFLFNTLHSINSLIGRDDEKARNMTIKISSLLRKVLDSSSKSSHLMEDEIGLINDYLDIEKERFKDRLTVILRFEDNVLGIEVPTLIIQPLVENAFKHGVSQVEGSTSLEVHVLKDENTSTLNIEVINDIPKVNNSRALSFGLGLANLRERLETYYDDKLNFTSDKNDNGKFIVKISIPLIE